MYTVKFVRWKPWFWTIYCSKMKALFRLSEYGKYPKIPYTKVSDKLAYANSADPYQSDQDLHCLLSY